MDIRKFFEENDLFIAKETDVNNKNHIVITIGAKDVKDKKTFFDMEKQEDIENFKRVLYILRNMASVLDYLTDRNYMTIETSEFLTDDEKCMIMELDNLIEVPCNEFGRCSYFFEPVMEYIDKNGVIYPLDWKDE